ncbi:MAG TPA: DUF4282 domain-containing protein [Stellaceae bacterium]|nr:DUF4282 domain-containing protein [Stellaceae bacterium]
MGEYLKFDRMITPILIQIVFWVMVVVFIVLGLISMFGGESGMQRLQGLLVFVLGPIFMRVLCENIIILFQINDKLHDIRENTKKG